MCGPNSCAGAISTMSGPPARSACCTRARCWHESEPPHPEEPHAVRRLEGWATSRLRPTLRDASLRDAPQGEVVGVAGMSEPKLLEVHDLSVTFGAGANAVEAVKRVS